MSSEAAASGTQPGVGLQHVQGADEKQSLADTQAPLNLRRGTEGLSSSDSTRIGGSPDLGSQGASSGAGSPVPGSREPGYDDHGMASAKDREMATELLTERHGENPWEKVNAQIDYVMLNEKKWILEGKGFLDDRVSPGTFPDDHPLKYLEKWYQPKSGISQC